MSEDEKRNYRKGAIPIEIVFKFFIVAFVTLVIVLLIKHFNLNVTDKVEDAFKKMASVASKFGVSF